jgi:serine/threonine protein kinase
MQLGMELGGYRIIAVLGQGGMGKVYLALNRHGQRVVLKQALLNDADSHQRLRDEGALGLCVRHANLVETEACVELGPPTGPLLVTRYIEGVSLFDVREYAGPMPAALVCRMGRDLAHALDALHHATSSDGAPLMAVHRDVTASNVMLSPDGVVRLIDFGIGKNRQAVADRTRTGFLRGTLRYLAPELFDARGPSPSSDLWSLGVLLAEALLGRPIARGTEAEVMGKICTGHLFQLNDNEQPNPTVWAAIEKLTQVNPDHRPVRGRDAAAIFAMAEKALMLSSWDVAASASMLVNKTRTHRAQARQIKRVPTPLTTAAEPHEVLLDDAIHETSNFIAGDSPDRLVGVLQGYRARLQDLER